MPKVSIITPCYNAEKYIRETYESVINQTYENFEWIIINDKSTDKTQDILETFNDPRIKIHHKDINEGVSLARNKGLELATGDLIAFLDADDLWLPNKLETQMKYHDKYDFTFHSYTDFIDDKLLKTQIASPVNFNELLKNCIIKTSTVMLKASLAKKYKFKPHLNQGEDFLYFLNILKDTKLAFGFNENLTKYRIEENSLSRDKLKMAKMRWIIMREDLNLSFLKSIYYFIHYAISGILKW